MTQSILLVPEEPEVFRARDAAGAPGADYEWWNSLRHHRLLIGPAALRVQFPPDDRGPLSAKKCSDLADRINQIQAGIRAEALGDWLEFALHEAIGLPAEGWIKGNQIGRDRSAQVGANETVRPRWIWQAPGGEDLPLFVVEGHRSIGIGRGRRDHARVLDWLRVKKRDLALVTNGLQWRLVYATETSDAWCESDVDDWIRDGAQGPGLTALRLLLASPDPGYDLPAQRRLREAIRATRRGHAELSGVLGERVRQAVEILIQGCAPAIDALLAASGPPVRLEHVYQAAIRVAMRLVVVLFAEARSLFASPSLTATRDAYWESYSLQKLRLLLEKDSLHGDGDRGATAWPRILALFRLLYHGSAHPELTRPAYGGRLFEPGDPDSPDPVMRALAVFERTDICPTDAQVARMLGLMARAPVRLRQGRAATTVELPVDFGQLDVEYVGILYEGLLDYELHRAGETMIFLDVGNQPVLPLSRLEKMGDEALREMMRKLAEKQKAGSEEGEQEAEEDDETDDTPDDAEETEDAAEETAEERDVSAEPDESERDDLRVARERTLAWAERAAVAAGIVKKPRGKKGEDAFREEVARAARALVARTVQPGELYLVRHGGTRKGSGTFYTKPALAEPTVANTLGPLVYAGEAPRTPAEILGVKVVDPACGSGAFLVAALRYLARALYESIVFHRWIDEHPDGRISWEDPENARPHWFKEALKDFRGLNETPDAALGVSPRERVETQLLRVVAERCIYGVDLNPLAVELAKLSLWIATLDNRLPFSFLEHKIKVGDALVGCWLDRVADYPVLAWNREGGDKDHKTAVHHPPGAWTEAIKEKKAQVKDEMRQVLSGQLSLFELPAPPEEVHRRARAAYEELHARAADPDAQAELYRRWRESPEFAALKDALDAWCAVWFWPADRLELVPTPLTLGRLPDDVRAAVREVAAAHNFFHWELEFPDAFAGDDPGFAAVVGNPPWETLQPNSREFFSNLDPLYRTYGKQAALARQRELFTDDPPCETDWIAYVAGYQAMANWVAAAAAPFGDPEEGERFALSASTKESAALHAEWRQRRAGRTGHADPDHPFRVQGEGKPYTYKLFLEQGLALLRRRGRLGMIVPSGVYSDRGSADLRRRFFEACSWDWLFGFVNHRKVFDIASGYKFGPVVVQKGGRTEAVQAAFMRRELEDWSRPEAFAVAVTREQIERFSPKSLALLEVRDDRDVRILEKMAANGVPLGHEGPDGWGVQYRQGDFNMTSDSHLFPPREKWEAEGYRPDEYGHWLKGRWVPIGEVPAGAFDRPGWVRSRDGASAIAVDEIGDVALPLYEGRMIGQFDFSQKGWVSGKGRSAVWREIPWEAKQIEPQYLLGLSHYSETREFSSFAKLGYITVSSSRNSRTMLSTILEDWPAGNSISFYHSHEVPVCRYACLAASLNSFVYDFAMKLRLVGLNLSEFLVNETVVLPSSGFSNEVLAMRSLYLSAQHSCFARVWMQQPAFHFRLGITPAERLRLRCILDAAVAFLYGLDRDDLRWILRDCDHPADRVTDKAFARDLDPKGFWRVDKEKDPELRHSVLTLVAFDALLDLVRAHGPDAGLRRFLGDGPDDGWMLPETLRLADHDLGRDERAGRPQPVARVLGPRFYDWQLAITPERARAECERHAENLRLIRSVGVDPDAPPAETGKRKRGGGKGGKKGAAQTNLFGGAA